MIAKFHFFSFILLLVHLNPAAYYGYQPAHSVLAFVLESGLVFVLGLEFVLEPELALVLALSLLLWNTSSLL